MHLKLRNVNDAFKHLVSEFNFGENVVKKLSRNGPVLKMDEPVCITYTHPLERCLFNATRDTNPFALLYESLYMLTGRNDVAPLAFYTRNFANYSDDGKTLNGSYGYRWRNYQQLECAEYDTDANTYKRTDQLDLIVAHLKANPDSRRAVLQMWDVESDLLKIDDRPHCPRCGSDRYPCCTGEKWVDVPPVMKGKSLDVCCNLNVMFSLRNVLEDVEPKEVIPPSKWTNGKSINLISQRKTYLDITVTNRSNDLVWGLLGANYVTFSVLAEYMAARLGAEVGFYHHFSNNLHVYTETNSGFKAKEWLAASDDPGWEGWPEWYTRNEKQWTSVPLVKDPEVFDKELPIFVNYNYDKDCHAGMMQTWREPFLDTVAQPMCHAFRCHKKQDYSYAMEYCDKIVADDWRIICKAWVQRRKDKKGAKNDR